MEFQEGAIKVEAPAIEMTTEELIQHSKIPIPRICDMVCLDQVAKFELVEMDDTIENRVETGWDGVSIPGTSDARLERINRKEVTR